MFQQKAVPINVGDSLSKIAHQQLGDVSKWREIADLNGLDIFKQLPIGSQLKIPSAADLERLATEQLKKVLGDKLGSKLDLSAIAQGKFHQIGDINQVIKLIDWLY